MLTRRRCCCDGGCQICVTVTDCAGTSPISGATITVKQGATTIDSCTTGASGRCCFTVAAGPYTVYASLAGYAGSNKDVAVTCPGTTNVGLTLQTTATQHKFTVTGCNGLALQGATVTINGGTYTTDSSGIAAYSAPAGTYSYSVSRSRFTTSTGSVTIACTGTNKAVSMSAATGYHCFISTCAVPAPDTLYLTDPVLGVVTLTYSAGNWLGSLTVNFVAYCSCPTKNGVQVDYGVGGIYGPKYTYLAPHTVGANLCPDPTGLATSLALDGAFTLISCEPLSFTVAFSQCTCIGTCINAGKHLWPGGGTTTFTVTE